MTPQDLDTQYKTALKAHNTTIVSVIRDVKNQVHIAEKNTGTPADEATVNKVLAKVQKTCQEERDIRAARMGDKEPRVSMLNAQIAWIESNLPSKMSQEDLEKLVADAIAATKCTSMRQMRDVLQWMRTNTSADFDNGQAAAIVKKKIL